MRAMWIVGYTEMMVYAQWPFQATKKPELCKCGHDIDDHSEGCPRCGFNECDGGYYGSGKYVDCDCEEFTPKTKKRKKRK